MVHPLLFLVFMLLSAYSWVLILFIIMGWLLSFEVLDKRNRFVQMVYDVLFKVTEPVLSKVRPYMPKIPNVDLSPIAVFILIELIEYSLKYYFVF